MKLAGATFAKQGAGGVAAEAPSNGRLVPILISAYGVSSSLTHLHTHLRQLQSKIGLFFASGCLRSKSTGAFFLKFQSVSRVPARRPQASAARSATA